MKCLIHRPRILVPSTWSGDSLYGERSMGRWPMTCDSRKHIDPITSHTTVNLIECWDGLPRAQLIPSNDGSVLVSAPSRQVKHFSRGKPLFWDCSSAWLKLLWNCAALRSFLPNHYFMLSFHKCKPALWFEDSPFPPVPFIFHKWFSKINFLYIKSYLGLFFLEDSNWHRGHQTLLYATSVYSVFSFSTGN